jgi:hypothetical protein
MKVYRYLFYKFYKLVCFLGNEDFYPEIKAYFLISLCIWANVLTLISIFEITVNKKVFSYLLLAILTILSLVFNYFIALRKDKYLQYLKEFDGETSSCKMVGNILAIFYIILSNVLFICTANLVRRNLIL